MEQRPKHDSSTDDAADQIDGRDLRPYLPGEYIPRGVGTAMRYQSDSRREQLEEVIGDPDRRRERILRDCAHILSQYHAATVLRQAGNNEPRPTPTQEVIDQFAAWMLLNDAAFHAAVESLYQNAESYLAAEREYWV